MTLSSSKDSDLPSHRHSLIRMSLLYALWMPEESRLLYEDREESLLGSYV